MPPIILPTTVAPITDQLSIAEWICIAIAIYVVLLTMFVCIRQCLIRQGFCGDCSCCGKDDEPTNYCLCCIECAQFCDCTPPDVKSCCDSLCGPRRTCDIDDCFSANCFSGGGGCCEASSAPLCQCPSCPEMPAVNCDCPECDEIVCCCIRISVMAREPI